MNRREFMASSACGALGAAALSRDSCGAGQQHAPAYSIDDARELFPRLRDEVFISAAGGTPLSAFTQTGLRRYEEFWRSGRGPAPWGGVPEMLADVRHAIARLINAHDSEIAFTMCTKHGEQIVLDGLDALRENGNIVTNDLHFVGSLHHLLGLRRAGIDVRIVRSRDFDVRLDDMAAAIDDNTALVAVTYVSNVNGRFEPLRELVEVAHARGAYVYADIIQAAGIVPVDVKALGVDFAAGNGYKWLFGPHGTGYLYVREDLQGTVLHDRLFPGHAWHNYEPWVDEPDDAIGDFEYRAPVDASRYRPGHPSYLGYCCVREGLRFIEAVGVENLQAHTVALCRRLVEQVDPTRYRCISPDLDQGPIVSFRLLVDPELLIARLRDAGIVISVSRGAARISPGVFNTEEDIDLLASVMNAA